MISSQKILLFCFILTVLSLLFYGLELANDPISSNPRPYNGPLRSKCNCHKDEVNIELLGDAYKISVSNKNTKSFDYLIPADVFENRQLTCDMYRSLRRGPHQQVVSYSLYGQSPFYNNLVKLNVQRVKEFYPSWVVRIYHDNTINRSMICELECSNSNVDFCDINDLPMLSVTHILPMTWRFLLIGDWFVDVFISRDTDSCVFDREVAAVNEWLSENTLFHIMRDNPAHGPLILGGMWGFKNKLDRKLAQHLFHIILSKLVQYWYQVLSPEMFNKGQDQFILRDYFWPLARHNSTMHDSFNCEKLGGRPFPTKRPSGASCFVGAPGCCEPNSEMKFTHQCPEKCRPADKVNEWIYC